MPEVPHELHRVRAVNATEPLRRHALVAPDAVAWVRADGVPLTYHALDRAVDALAHRLRAADLRPGTTVALFAHIPLRTLRASAYIAACHGRIGNPDRARPYVEECLAANPAFSIRQFMSKEPFRNPDDAAFLAESLRIAGLPD